MSVDPINRFNPIGCIVALVTMCGVVGQAPAAVAPQATSHYPLESSVQAPSSHSQTQPPAVLPVQRVSAPADELTTAIEQTRQSFAGQFEKAYTQLEQANVIRVARLPDRGDETSVVDFRSATHAHKSELDLAAGPAKQQPSANQSLMIRWLPDVDEVSNVTQRFPRVASAVGLTGSLAADNNVEISPVPPLPQADLASNAFQPAATASVEPSLDWWTSLVQQPLHPQNQTQPIDSNWLVYMALQNSPRIQALSRDPLIRDFEVIEADSAFDPVSFLQTQFADRSDPLGGALDATRDGRNTIENHNWTAEGGVRGRDRLGATYELSQRLGFQNSNVAVFDPNNQGTAQLALNVTQPLARGRGRYINQSQILIAQSRGGAAWESFASELQEEIEAVVSAYWRLYYDRSVFLQKKRNVERAAKILETLEGRAGLDSLPSQITRARSSLQTRKTGVANAFRDVRNSETELRRLIADRNWMSNQTIELLPAEAPTDAPLGLSVQHVVTTALNNRPEIRESLQRAKIAGIEKDISVNELLPEISLLLGTYISTLEGDSRLGDAFSSQFGDTKPGYSVGLEFELPIRNRAARSRLVQRKLQLAKIKNEVDESMQNVIAESQTSLRRLDSAWATLAAAKQAIEAAQSDLDQNVRRWESFALIEGDFADGQTPTTVLDQLLDSQERLAAAELTAAQSQMELKIAEVALQRTMGTLLTQKQINPRRVFNCGQPAVQY